MNFPLACTSNGSPSNSAVSYALFMGNAVSGWNTTEANTTQVVAAPFSIKNFGVFLTSAPGGSASLTFTVRKNGTDTAATVTITGAATTGQDTTHEVSFSPGDTFNLSCTPTGTPTVANLSWRALCNSLTSASQILSTGITGTISSAKYFNIFGGDAQTSLNITKVIMPCAGVFSKLSAALRTAPGGSASWTIAVTLNGTDSSLSTTISAANTTGTNSANTIRVAAGDMVAFHMTPASTPAATRVSIGMVFTPDKSGNAICGYSSALSNPSNSATRFTYPVGAPSTVWSATDKALVRFPQVRITAFYANIDVTPGAGKNYVFTLNKNTVNTLATVTIADSNQTASVNNISEQLLDGDRLSIQSTPNNTPTGSATVTISYILNYPGGGWSSAFF